MAMAGQCDSTALGLTLKIRKWSHTAKKADMNWLLNIVHGAPIEHYSLFFGNYATYDKFTFSSIALVI